MTISNTVKYLRVSTFSRLKTPFAKWARSRRMGKFVEAIHLHEGISVLDLGGTASIWASVPSPSINVTLLNLEYGPDLGEAPSSHSFRYLVGDACNVTGFADGSFDLVFSNSVIEHVGDAERRSAFACEVRRLGRGYWIQTPSKWFPIEAHNGMPFWWFYPKRLRTSLIASWRKKLPGWTDMVEGTDIVTRAELRELFPEATILVERVLGMPKSYVAFHPPSPF
jgi:hypothetical protein